MKSVRAFACIRYKPLIDVDTMVQVAGIRIYYNLIVPRHILLNPAAQQCDQSTQEARNKISRCATCLRGCPPHHIIRNSTLTEKREKSPKTIFCPNFVPTKLFCACTGVIVL